MPALLPESVDQLKSSSSSEFDSCDLFNLFTTVSAAVEFVLDLETPPEESFGDADELGTDLVVELADVLRLGADPVVELEDMLERPLCGCDGEKVLVVGRIV